MVLRRKTIFVDVLIHIEQFPVLRIPFQRKLLGKSFPSSFERGLLAFVVLDGVQERVFSSSNEGLVFEQSFVLLSESPSGLGFLLVEGVPQRVKRGFVVLLPKWHFWFAGSSERLSRQEILLDEVVEEVFEHRHHFVIVHLFERDVRNRAVPLLKQLQVLAPRSKIAEYVFETLLLHSVHYTMVIGLDVFLDLVQVFLAVDYFLVLDLPVLVDFVELPLLVFHHCLELNFQLLEHRHDCAFEFELLLKELFEDLLLNCPFGPQHFLEVEEELFESNHEVAELLFPPVARNFCYEFFHVVALLRQVDRAHGTKSKERTGALLLLVEKLRHCLLMFDAELRNSRAVSLDESPSVAFEEVLELDHEDVALGFHRFGIVALL